jgi:hypothetical protein
VHEKRVAQSSLGPNNAYSGSGGIVSGLTIPDDLAVLLGGQKNVAESSGVGAVIAGGKGIQRVAGRSRRWWRLNEATDTDAVAVGGSQPASGLYSACWFSNEASNTVAVAVGGIINSPVVSPLVFSAASVRRSNTAAVAVAAKQRCQWRRLCCFRRRRKRGEQYHRGCCWRHGNVASGNTLLFSAVSVMANTMTVAVGGNGNLPVAVLRFSAVRNKSAILAQLLLE